jgi:hypothetical protein
MLSPGLALPANATHHPALKCAPVHFFPGFPAQEYCSGQCRLLSRAPPGDSSRHPTWRSRRRPPYRSGVAPIFLRPQPHEPHALPWAETPSTSRHLLLQSEPFLVGCTVPRALGLCIHDHLTALVFIVVAVLQNCLFQAAERWGVVLGFVL